MRFVSHPLLKEANLKYNLHTTGSFQSFNGHIRISCPYNHGHCASRCGNPKVLALVEPFVNRFLSCSMGRPHHAIKEVFFLSEGNGR